MDAPPSRFEGKRHQAKLQRMKAAYLIEPGSVLERWKQRRAERWLIADSMGPAGTSLHDTREHQAALREQWRQWRAAQLREP